MRIVKKSSWFLFLGLLAISCLEQPDCFRLNSNEIGILFKVLGTNKTDPVALSQIEIQGVNGVFYPDTTLSSLVLPLNYLKDETTITILGEKVSGTMLLKYLSQAQFVSDECGPRFVLSELAIADQSGFDSVHVVTSEVNNPPYINLEIYRCPVNNLVKFDFYQLYIASPNKKTSQLLAVNINEIKAEYSGDVFYQNKSTNTVTLPINLAASPSNYSFTIDGKLNDLSVSYVLTNSTRYNACGEQTFASALQAISTEFDSVSIATTTVSNKKKSVDAPQDPAVTNVLIFKCPKTNLMKVSFKASKGDSYVSKNILLDSITSNFSTNKLYVGVSTNLVELPINEASSNVEYYFSMNNGSGLPSTIDTLKVNYGAINTTLFNACGAQFVYNKLKVSSPDIALSNLVVPKDSLQFPSVTNIEIIK